MAYFLVILIFATNILCATCEEPTNNILFEKVVVDILDHNWLSYMNGEARPIARNVFKVNFTAVFKKPLTTAWCRLVLYYKSSSNVYRKYLVDVWEDACELFRGSKTAPVSRYILDTLLKGNISINVPLRCPFSGTFTMAHPRFNITTTNLPLMNAGRYRLDVFVVTRKGGNPIGVIQFFGSISDIRVWF